MAIQTLDSRVFIGPSTWALVRVIQLTVDIGELEERPTNTIDGFTDRLIDLIPTLHDHQCSVGRPGGLVERMREGTWIGHVLEHVALELQNLAGSEVARGLTRSTDSTGIYDVVYQYQQRDLGLAAGELARRLLNWIIYNDDPDFNFEHELELLIRLAERLAYGPSTRALVEEAERRAIPVMRLDDSYSLVQLGHGVYQQRIWATTTSLTSNIAVDLASNKRLTNQMLRGIGIPVPRGVTVSDTEEAVKAARSVGFPVVVKPEDGNHGRGVRINLKNDDDVRTNFELARGESRSGRVIVESFIEGNDHRILVVGGRVIAVAERVPAHVKGDGEHTVEELIDITNSDPRRGIGHEKVLTRITIDNAVLELLASQDLQLESIPEARRFVQLRLTGNLSTGGTAIDRTDDIHPDNVEIAEQAARVIGLDIAGIDVLVRDISKPIKDQNGAICEVNAGPGFRMHTNPTEGHPRDVARPVIERLFPPGAEFRVPIIAVTGSNGKTTTTRMISHILKMAGKRVGMTTTDGIYIDGTQILKGDMSGPLSARMVLQNPTVEVAILETARGGILRQGLGFDRCDVGVVTNITGDHLGKSGIESIRDLARVKAVVPRAVFRDGFSVLNADDPRCMAISKYARGDLVLFSMDANNERIREHLRLRGIAVVLRETAEGEVIYILEGRRETAILNVRHIPATFEGRARFNVKNALAAAAAGYVSNCSIETIRTGLRSFTTSFYQTPGRANVATVRGFQVLIDYCHNPAGLEELADFIGRLKPRRTLAMIAMPGDRRNEDIATFGQIAASAFDQFIVREDRHPRGRRPGEVAGIMRQALIDNGVAADAIRVIPDELEATRAALDSAESDDLVLLLADTPDQVWEIVTTYSLTEQPKASLIPAD
ncbi:cyanophycin synthetase [soil metagenome]